MHRDVSGIAGQEQPFKMLITAALQRFVHLISELQNRKIWVCWELSGKRGNLSQTPK